MIAVGTQHVVLAVDELRHRLLERPFAHLTVRHRDPRLRDELADAVSALVQAFDAVVDEERLTAAAQLAPDRFGDQMIVPPRDHRSNRASVDRSGGDPRQIAEATDRELHRAGDRGRGQRQDIDLLFELLDAFLMRHPEALLLIHDEQAQSLKMDVFAEQSMGSDQDIDLAGLGRLDDLGLARAIDEARDHFDPERVGVEAVDEGVEVLLREHCGGAEDRDLARRHRHPKRRADRDFGFPEADVTTHDPIHRLRLLEVTEHVVDRARLVGGLLVRKRRLKLGVDSVRSGEGVAFEGESLGVEAQELLGHLSTRFFIFAFVRENVCPPSRSIRGRFPSAPAYFWS